MLPLMRQAAGTHRWLQLSSLILTLCQVTRATQPSTPPLGPAPIVVSASNDWEGNDGPWSTFTIEIGTPPQSVNVLLSTAAYQTWGVDPAGCTSTDPTTCATSRGRFYNNTASMSWEPNEANITTDIYDLELESDLGYSGKGRYGFDAVTLGYVGGGGPTLANQTVASIAAKDFYMGVFGVKPQASNFTTVTDPVPSFMQNLRAQNIIPSLSWAYTAGNQYRLNEVYGSLILGGYDASKFKPNSLSFNFGPQDNRELIVQLNSLTTNDGTSLLQQPIPMFLDSTVPYIYLPEAACAVFESTFGLTWDSKTELYLLTDAQHTALKAQNPKITFTLGTLTSVQTVDIVLPYAAFDLTVSYPIVANQSRYFPLKRANDSSQYTLGRTFFQEAYVIADYDRRNFSVSACNWDASAAQNVVAILPPSDAPPPGNSTQDTAPAASTPTHHVPIAVISSAAGGLVLLGLILTGILFILRRRKRKANGIKIPDSTSPSNLNSNQNINSNRKSILQAELAGCDPDSKSQIHEFPSNSDVKAPLEMSGQPVELDPYGRKWPPVHEAVEIGPSRHEVHEVYEMDAGEVAIEMSGIGNGRRRSKGGRLMSFMEGDDWDKHGRNTEVVSPRSVRFPSLRGGYGNGREAVSPPSRAISPASPMFGPSGH